MKEVAKYSGCFVCGDNNSVGLRAKFFFDDGTAFTEYTAEKRFEGYLGVLHGGIISTLLDEVMIKSLLARGIYSMTVELTVRFKKAVNVGEKLFLEGYVEEEKGRLFITGGEVRNENGDVVASSIGKYLRVNENMREQLMKSLDTS